MTDLVLINPGSRKAVFQDLGLEDERSCKFVHCSQL